MTNWIGRAEKAANFLAETDEDIALLKEGYERAKRKTKAVWSTIYLRAVKDDAGKSRTVEERKAVAETHETHQEAIAAELKYLEQWEVLKNRRETANTIIDFWRSYNKAQQEGHV